MLLLITYDVNTETPAGKKYKDHIIVLEKEGQVIPCPED